MTPEEFVRNFYIERKSLIGQYLSSDSQTDAAALIAELGLDEQKREKLREVLNSVLGDAFYKTLLGLDGEAQIGGRQENFRIEDENGEVLTGGEIEVFAHEYFHNNRFELCNSSADFIAIVTIMTWEQGGHRMLANGGYRTKVKFDFDLLDASAELTFIEREIVFPGDRVEAEIRIFSADSFADKLSEKAEFEFKEGSTVIGKGTIKHIINENLRRGRGNAQPES